MAIAPGRGDDHRQHLIHGRCSGLPNSRGTDGDPARRKLGVGNGGATSSLNLTACTVQSVAARCGQLAVRENPAAPNGRKISLNVVVLPARLNDRAPDPLFYFASGPGGAATDSTAWAHNWLGSG